MFENIAAIDIGTYAIKVVTVKTGFRDFQLKSFIYEYIDLERDNFDDAVRESLEKILIEEDFSNYKILTNLPMEKAIIRNVTFPFNDVEKIADAIPFEAEENIPFSIDDLVLDFQSLKSENREEGRILLGATHKENMYDFLKLLDDFNIKPVKMGMESNALLECYKYFNKTEDESVIQLHIGNNKTIINLIKNNSLLYTRSISIGISMIHEVISDILNIKISEAVKLYEKLDLDINSLENNYKKGNLKKSGLTKQKIKKIYNRSIEVIDELIEQIIITIKAYSVANTELNLNRILISGGGSNLSGIGTHLLKNLDVPVISLPFISDYNEEKIQAQFPVAFGTILSYINKKSQSINFLKGEFIPDVISATKRIYYLSGFFLAFTVFVFIVNIIITTILTSKSNRQYNDIISQRYKQYFSVKKIPHDPVASAMKLLKKEKSELESMQQLIKEDTSLLDLLDGILKNFSADTDFDLKSIVINERVIRIDGTIGSGKIIDDFKNELQKSKQFDSVSLDIKYSRKNEIRFTLSIKQKNLDKGKTR